MVSKLNPRFVFVQAFHVGKGTCPPTQIPGLQIIGEPCSDWGTLSVIHPSGVIEPILAG